MTALYQADYGLWAHHQAQLLRTGKYAQLDIDNLVAEVLHAAKQERKTLHGHVEKLLHHILTLKLHPERSSAQRLSKLHLHRHRIQQSIARMPAMATLLDAYFAETYADVAARLTAKAGLPRNSLPDTLPYTKEQLLERNFMPWTTVPPDLEQKSKKPLSP